MFRLRAWQMRLFLPGLAGVTDHRLEMHGKNDAEPRTAVGYLVSGAVNAAIVVSAIVLAFVAMSLIAKGLVALGWATPQPHPRRLISLGAVASASCLLGGATIGGFAAGYGFHAVAIVKYRFKLTRGTCEACRRSILYHQCDSVSMCDFCSNFNRSA